MDSTVKMGRQRKSCVVASKTTGEKEKKVLMKKMGVGLALSPNLKAKKAKAVSQSSPCNRPGGRDVKIYNKKVDYSKMKAVQPSTVMEGPLMAVTQINDVVYRIQRNPRSRIILVDVDQIDPDERP
jgi:hypothetical protein